ncbi:MAG TPA: hypothetical protein PLX95_01395 [bacterium]|nr:hypothetical protein [bacterium]
MTKKLSAKKQELNPELSQFSNSFSKCIDIEPENQETLLKKGTVNSVFEISGNSNFDTDFVVKVITDILHNSYYSSDNISPVQTMEKTISEIKEKVLQLSSDTLIASSNEISFNFVSSILWGNVLYIVKVGEVEIYTMKGGEVIPLEMISEGNFSSFSKIVDEDDIFIFCTKPFAQEYPPEKLLQTSIPEGTLKENQSCLLYKLLLDTKTPQDAEIDTGLGEAVQKSKQREFNDNIATFLNKVLGLVSPILNKVGLITKPLLEKISSLISKLIPKRKMVLFTRKIEQTTRGKNKKVRAWILLGLISFIAAFLVFNIFKSFVFKEKPKPEEPVEEVHQAEIKEEVVVEDRSKDEEYKIFRIKPEVFYDIKIADSEAEPTEIQIINEKIVVVDKNTGKIFKSEVSLPNFSVEPNTYIGIRSLGEEGGLVTFLDDEGYKTYDIANSQLKDTYDLSSAKIVYPYSGYIYSVSDDVLNRGSVQNNELTQVVWGQNQNFKDAVSISIAYSVYVLTSQGELVNYSGGVKTDFTVSGLDKTFSNPVKVAADLDFQNIYVADRGNNRVIVLNEDGELLKQYKNDDDSLWRDIRSISISSDEKYLFVLDTSKLYKVSLE